MQRETGKGVSDSCKEKKKHRTRSPATSLTPAAGSLVLRFQISFFWSLVHT